MVRANTTRKSGSSPKDLDYILDELCEALSRNRLFAYDRETSGFNPFTRKSTGISFAVPDELVPANCSNKCCPDEMFPKSWYLPFMPERAHHMTNEEARRRYPGQYFSVRQVIDRISPYMEDPDKAKVGQNLKFDLKFDTKEGIRTKGQIIDTCVGSSLCDENRSKHDLKTLAMDYLAHDMVRFKELGGLFSASMESYGADDSCQSLRLWTDIFEPQLKKEGLLKVFLELECRIVPILCAMELKGCKIDVGYLDELARYLSKLRAETEEKAWKAAGQQFQITSPEAVGNLLFNVLRWRKKGQILTATGKISTAEDVLSRYVDDKKTGPLAKAILTHRKIGKLKETYVDTLRKDALALDGRVRSLFNQVHKPWENKGGAVTGRFSSSRDKELGGTNFQNIPLRPNPYLGDTGKKIRNAFIAEEGNVLVILDYAQIELRFMAHLSQDPTLLKAYRGWDCAECGAKGELVLVTHECPKCGAGDGHRRREKGCKICDERDVPEGAPVHGFCLGLDLHQITADLCKIPRFLGKMVNFLLLYGGQPKLLASKADIGLKLAEVTYVRYFKAYPGIKRYHDRMIRQVMRTGFVTTVLKRRRRFPHKRGRSIKPWEHEWRQIVNFPVQGSAADLMKVGMRNIHERFDREGLLVDDDTGLILQVHDEVCVETPKHRQKYVFELMRWEMEHAMAAASGLDKRDGITVPVVASGSCGSSWGSCK